MDLRRPDRRTPRRVQKTFENVHSVWALYMERNMTSERYNLYRFTSILTNHVYLFFWTCSHLEPVEPEVNENDDR